MWWLTLTVASGAQIDIATPMNTHKMLCNGATMELVSDGLLRCEVPVGTHRVEVRSVTGKTLAYTDVQVAAGNQRSVLGYRKRNLYPIETTTVQETPEQVAYSKPSAPPAPESPDSQVMAVHMSGPDGQFSMVVSVPDDFFEEDGAPAEAEPRTPMTPEDFNLLWGRILPDDGRLAILDAAVQEHYFTVAQAIQLTPPGIEQSERIAMYERLVHRLTDPQNVHLLVAHINTHRPDSGGTVRRDHVGNVAAQADHPVTMACRETFAPPRDSKCITKAAQRADGAREVRACSRLNTPDLVRECFDRLQESRHPPAPILEACIGTMGADVQAMRCFNVTLDAKDDPVQDIRACSVLSDPDDRRRCIGRFNEVAWEPSPLISACMSLVPTDEIQTCLRAGARGATAPTSDSLEACRNAGKTRAVLECIERSR